MFDKIRLEIKQRLELHKLQKQKDEGLRKIRQEKQFEINKTSLERDVELEQLKAEVRKEQQKSLPKPGTQLQKKSAFAAFQDYCTDFAERQQDGSSIAGEFKFGGENGKGKRKKNSKGSGAGIIGRL